MKDTIGQCIIYLLGIQCQIICIMYMYSKFYVYIFQTGIKNLFFHLCRTPILLDSINLLFNLGYHYPLPFSLLLYVSVMMRVLTSWKGFWVVTVESLSFSAYSDVCQDTFISLGPQSLVVAGCHCIPLILAVRPCTMSILYVTFLLSLDGENILLLPVLCSEAHWNALCLSVESLRKPFLLWFLTLC